MSTTGLEIAVVGMACRFPDAGTPEELWSNLREGVESVTFFGEDELREAGVPEDVFRHPDYVPAAAVLGEPYGFDAGFFGFSPREAEILDPQHRHFMECAWEALEGAGSDPRRFDGRIGVYAGTSMNSYLFSFYHQDEVLDPVNRYQTLILSDKDYLPTRLAYKLDLGGPGIAIQTACSTSLVAVHLACRALLGGECEMALAGGVSVKVPHRVGYLYREGGIASPDGHCRAFDAEAAGSVGGNGVGIVVLKRLEDALADGDHVHAVIKGSAVNNDGALKVGYTAPSVEGQAEVIRGAQMVAEVEPAAISYVEAHGTGTALGDPIELAALREVFGDSGGRRSCGLGSIKTNIGHLDAAAGVAGLIKTALALEHGEIPPSLHFREPSPESGLDEGPFYVTDRLEPWERKGEPRRAGVSSFGIGGTNAHVVLEEAPVREEAVLPRSWQLVRLSARTPEALERATDRLAGHLADNPDAHLRDVAFTLQKGRRSFPHRRFVVASRADAAARALGEREPAAVLGAEAAGEERPVAFLFPGLGTQYVGMGSDLYRRGGRFREVVDRASEVLQPELGIDVREVLYAGEGTSADEPAEGVFRSSGPELRRMLRSGGADDEASGRLRRTAVVQPVLFTVEYALAEQWRAWGLRPDALLGYSIGEYVAACVAGVLSPEDALRLVARRAGLIEALPPGAMLAVPLPEAEVESRLEPSLSISAVNGPSTTVVAGPLEVIDSFERSLADDGHPARRLETSHAFHSSTMEPVEAALTDLVRGFDLAAPKIPYLSNVTGTWITAEEATDPRYWGRHSRLPVRFADSVSELWKAPRRLLLECGPGQTLCSLASQHPDRSSGTEHLCLSSLAGGFEHRDAGGLLLQTLGKLWLAGIDIDWTRFHGDPPPRRVPLPTYPFEHRTYRIAPTEEDRLGGPVQRTDAGQGSRPPEDGIWIGSWRRAVPRWRDPEPRLVIADATSWLVLTPPGNPDGKGSADPSRLLAEAGARVLPLASDDRRRDFTSPEVWAALFADLAERGERPDGILHLWGAAEPGADSDGTADLPRKTAALLQGLLLAADGRPAPPVLVVTRGAYRVLGTEQTDPAPAAVAELCREAARNQPELDLRCLDLDGEEPTGAAETVLGELAEAAGETVVAERRGVAWLPSAEPLLPDGHGTAGADRRADGGWAFVGRLEGTAAALAEEVAEEGAAIALIGPRAGHRSAAAEVVEAGDVASDGRSGFDLEASGDEILALEAAALADLRAEGLRGYRALQDVADELCSAHLVRFLRQSGLQTAPGTGLARRRLEETLDVAPQYRRFLDYMLEILAEDGILQVEGGALRFLEAASNLSEPAALRREIEGREPRLSPLLDLLERAVASYPEILSGRVSALEVLYPGGSSDLVESLYSSLHDFRNDRVHIEVVRRFLSRLARAERERPLRILEVGAGNGFLTWEVAPALSGLDVRYHVSDLGQLFVAEARREAGRRGLDFMEFDVLDISRDPAAQGLPPHSFDVVTGLNVVHATPRIDETLGHLESLLAPDGLLLLVEGVRSQRWNNLVWGLTEAWWHFRDPELRSGTPLLPLEAWEKVIARQGFAATLSAPADPAVREELDHALLVMQQSSTVVVPPDVLAAGGGEAESPSAVLERIRASGGRPAVFDVDPDDLAAVRTAVAGAEERFGRLSRILHRPTSPEDGGGTGGRLARHLELRAGLQQVALERRCAWIGVVDGDGGEIGAAERGITRALAERDPRAPGLVLFEDPRDGAHSDALSLSLVETALFRGVHEIHGRRRRTAAAGQPDAEVAATAGSGHDRPLLGTEYEAPRTDLEELVVELWAEILGVEKIGIHDNFFELGGDSLIGLKVMSRLADQLPVGVPVQTLFDRPTVASLAEALEQSLIERLEHLSEDEAARLLAETAPAETMEEAPGE